MNLGWLILKNRVFFIVSYSLGQVNRAASIYGFGLALRLALIWRFPLIFGGDPMIRMLHRDRILASHQLPLLQIILAAISRVTMSYVAVMCIMAAIGAGVGVAFYLLARHFVSDRAAFCGGMLMTVEPLVAAHSIVPFQESLMLLCVLMAFHYFYAERWALSAVWIALGCFTRYESWIAAAVLAAWSRSWKSLAFVWAPIAWMIYQRGLAPEGSYVVDTAFHLERFVRWVYLAYITFRFSPVIVIALAAGGVWFAWPYRKKLWPLAAFVIVFSVAILFSAHGEQKNPERLVASREAHFWMAAVVLLAGFAIDRWIRYGAALAALGVALGMWGTYQYLSHEASDPRLQLSYQLAKFFDREMKPGERALIVSPPWDRALFDFYLQRARETGGEPRYKAAVRNLAESDMSPPDYQRMLIHSKLDRSRFLYESKACTEWTAVWGDAGRAENPVTTLTAGNLRVEIAKKRCD